MSDDSPSVIGPRPPMPTEADYKAAFKRLFVEHMVKLSGCPEGNAEAEFDAAPWDDIRELTPEIAAETAMEVWSVN